MLEEKIMTLCSSQTFIIHPIFTLLRYAALRTDLLSWVTISNQSLLKCEYSTNEVIYRFQLNLKFSLRHNIQVSFKKKNCPRLHDDSEGQGFGSVDGGSTIRGIFFYTHGPLYDSNCVNSQSYQYSWWFVDKNWELLWHLVAVVWTFLAQPFSCIYWLK